MNRTIYTDGGCRDGIGSWAYIVLDEEFRIVDSKSELVEDTTNNRMEMIAIIEAVKSKDIVIGDTISVVSDSIYVVRGIDHPEYLKKWLVNGWKTSANKPVKNIDLWKELHAIATFMNIDFRHIRGHQPNDTTDGRLNNLVDELCSAEIKNYLKRGYK